MAEVGAENVATIKRIVNEAIARCNGGQVDGLPTRRRPSISTLQQQRNEDRVDYQKKVDEIKIDLRALTSTMAEVGRSLDRVNARLEAQDREADRDRRTAVGRRDGR